MRNQINKIEQVILEHLKPDENTLNNFLFNRNFAKKIRETPQHNRFNIFLTYPSLLKTGENDLTLTKFIQVSGRAVLTLYISCQMMDKYNDQIEEDYLEYLVRKNPEMDVDTFYDNLTECYVMTVVKNG